MNETAATQFAVKPNVKPNVRPDRCLHVFLASVLLLATAFTPLAQASENNKPSKLASVEPVAKPSSTAQPNIVSKLQTNQAYIEDISSVPTFNVDDPMSVFSFIMSQLPEHVRVYPTENYYYFRFHFRGTPYAGNLRLAANERDKGNLSFAYFRDYQAWFSQQTGHYSVLNAEKGVQVEKVGKLAYRVSYQDQSAVFHLNDLTGVAPAKGDLRPNEKYIGPAFDESGLQFFLIYNPNVKMFHYVLNETEDMPERLYTSGVSDRILIGNRTGFAFYKDRHADRKILIGVHNANANVNNYFDGPFDQLPDNFIKGNELKDAILDSDPVTDKNMDRYGNAPGKDHRYMIAPYRHYSFDDDLVSFDTCAEEWKETKSEEYYACFIAHEEQ